MSWSFGEIRSLCVKATKGAGLPWGLAEEAAFCVDWLERCGLPGVDTLAAYLVQTEEKPSMTADQCPITQGTWISDTQVTELGENLSVLQPLLLAPFLSLNVGNDPARLSWGGGSLTFSCAGIAEHAGNLKPVSPQQVALETHVHASVSPAAKTRIGADRDRSIAVLNRFAAKTYAPATEQSRLAGAGAGTSDND